MNKDPAKTCTYKKQSRSSLRSIKTPPWLYQFTGICFGTYGFYLMATEYPNISFGMLFSYLLALSCWILPLDFKS